MMQGSAFKAWSPLEIGDVVMAQTYERHGSEIGSERFSSFGYEPVEKLCTVTEIVCLHYASDGRIEFSYELDGTARVPLSSIRYRVEGTRRIPVRDEQSESMTTYRAARAEG